MSEVVQGSDGAVDALADQLACALIADAPRGWVELHLQTSRAGRVGHYVQQAVMADGSLSNFPGTSKNISGPCKALRAACYLPGRGTWFLMRMRIDADHQMVYEVDYDSEPAGRLSSKAGSYVQDLALFPRQAQHRPAWLDAAVARSDRASARNAAARARRDERTAQKKAERDAAETSGHADDHQEEP